MSLNVLLSQFTIGTIGTQIEAQGDFSGDVPRLFNLCFACSWVVCPFIGALIDKVGFPKVMSLVNALLICVCSCPATKLRPLHYVACVLYAMGRVSLWATFFSFMGGVFGFGNYGKLAGGGLFLSSCVSLLQYVLLSMTIEHLGSDFRI